VRFSPAFKWLVLLLLPLTLALKLAARPADSGPAEDRPIERKVEDFLVRQHFNVTVAGNFEEGKPTIRASAGLCQLLVAKSPAMGWDREMIRRYEAPTDHVFVVFHGRVYQEQPTWLTVFDALWTRFLRGLGSAAQPAPVLAVIAPASCQAEQLPWGQLG
jgi:hypothetical protein